MEKRFGSRSVSVSLTGADQIVLGPNPKRVWLHFSAPTAGRVSVGFGEAAVAEKGLTFVSILPGAGFGYAELGEQIHSAIHVIGTAGQSIGVVETDGECPCRE